MAPNIAREGGSIEICEADIMSCGGGLGNSGRPRADAQRDPHTVIWRHRYESGLVRGFEMICKLHYSGINNANHR